MGSSSDPSPPVPFFEVSLPDEIMKMVFPKLFSDTFPHLFEDHLELMALETFQEKLAYLLAELQNEGVFKFLDANEIPKLSSTVKSLQAMIKREALKQKLKEQGEEIIRDMRNESNQGNMSMKEYVEKITATRIQKMIKESAERIEEMKKKNKNS